MDCPRKKRRRGGIKVEKIKEVINREFQKELDLREKQLELVQQRMNQAQKTLHILRYVLVTNYYNNADKNAQTCQFNENIGSTPPRLHPAIKKLLNSFSDINLDIETTSPRRRVRQEVVQTTKQGAVPSTSSNEPSISNLIDNIVDPKLPTFKLPSQVKEEVIEHSTHTTVTTTERIAPNLTCDISENYQVPRNRNKKKYIVVVGNISKWTPAESAEDKSTHKWMVYVRGPKLSPNISNFVQRVVFYLHPSYKPNDVVEIKEQPFHLSRRGWGEFPLRVRIYFVHSLNKPVDIVHQLKLDQTFTGRQTLGNETVVSLHLYTNESIVKSETIVEESHISQEIVKSETFVKKESDIAQHTDKSLEHTFFNLNIKQECPEENTLSIFDLDHSYCSRTAVTATPKHIEQPENDLIYGLDYYKPFSTKSDKEHLVVEVVNIPKTVTKAVVTSNKRTLQNPLINSVFTKKLRLDDPSIDYSKFQIAIPKQRFNNVLQVLPFLYKHLPLITKLARDNTYKCTYPYVAATLQEYSSWNIGRRLSSEWFQAKTILNIIKKSHIPDYTNWTTKKLIIYARAHGYTPLANYSIFQRNSPDYAYDYIPNGKKVQRLKPLEPQEEIIEIIESTTVTAKPTKYSSVTQLIDLNLQKATSFIKHAVLDVGVILKPEEIVPGVLFNAAEKVLLQAVLCLSDDIIRKARAKLVSEGNFREDASIITTDHICKVLSSRSEFNLLLQSD